MRNSLFLALASVFLAQAPSWAVHGPIVDIGFTDAHKLALPPRNGPLVPIAAPGLPALPVAPAAFPASALPTAAAPAVAAQTQIRALGSQLSAAQQGSQSPKDTLDQAFERSVAEATGEAVPAPAAAPSQASGPSLSSYEKDYHPAPQPPAPKDPRTFWQKHGDTIKGASLGTIILAASTLILGAKSLEIPAFVGMVAGLLPYLRTIKNGKAGDFMPIYVQSVLGAGAGLVFGWGMSHLGYSTIMAGYSVMAGAFVPYLTSGIRKPVSEALPMGQMLDSAFAGAFVGATLPVWLGAKLGRKIGQRKSSAK